MMNDTNFVNPEYNEQLEFCWTGVPTGVFVPNGLCECKSMENQTRPNVIRAVCSMNC